MKDEALKLALEAMERYQVKRQDFDRFADEITALREALAEQPAQQEPVACSVCDQVHSILDGDASKIIRNAKDGYPDGRSPRILTLQERVTALCRYASDWKRWCLEKENTPPPAQQEPVAFIVDGDLYYPEEVDWETLQEQGHTVVPLYTSPPAQRTWVSLTNEQIWLEYQARWPFHPAEEPRLAADLVTFARAIEAAHNIKE